MFKRILSLCLLLSCFLNTIAQTAEMVYTVMATSGLNLRAEPNLQSKKVVRMPFGAVVEVIDNSLAFEPDQWISIDGTPGYWMEVTYGNQQGFAYSAYLKGGDNNVLPAEEGLNSDFRILYEGYFCEGTQVNYSPELHWYALLRKGETTELQPVEIEAKLWHTFSEQETREAYAAVVDENAYKVETNLDEKAFMLIGSKEPLASEGKATGRLIKGNYAFEEEGILGRFIYPEEILSLNGKSVSGLLGARENVHYEESAATLYRSYQLYYQFPGVVEEVDLSLALDLSKAAKLHAGYQTPKLVWRGDLNGDGWADLVFWSDTMVDHCGGSSSTHLLLTEGGVSPTIRQVAKETHYPCY